VQREMWTYPETLGRLDVTGFDVEAQDGSMGKVDEVTYEVGESYIVVDTGPWILGKKVLLPAGLIERVDRDDETVYVDRTRRSSTTTPTAKRTTGQRWVATTAALTPTRSASEARRSESRIGRSR
jgi:hypothetical protein